VFYYYRVEDSVIIKGSSINSKLKPLIKKEGLSTLKNMGFSIKKKKAIVIFSSGSSLLLHEMHELSTRLVYGVFGLYHEKNVTLSY